MNSDILRFIRYFNWCSLTGRLWWKPRTAKMFNTKGTYPKESLAVSWNKRWAGKEAFTAVGSHGYKTGAIEGKNYLAHRVIWFLEYGWWPDVFLDHINGDRLDNRLINLRPVNHTDSVKNQKLRHTSMSGCHGVTWRKDTEKWHARVTIGNNVIILGDYEELSVAISVRKYAEKQYGFHKNHGRN